MHNYEELYEKLDTKIQNCILTWYCIAIIFLTNNISYR